MMLSQTGARASRRWTNSSRRDGGECTETPRDDVVIGWSAAAATLVGEIISDTQVSFDFQTMLLRLSAKDFVPVTSLDGRPKPHERNAELSCKELVPIGKAIARSISVSGATEKCVRKHCNIDEQRLERRDRARPHATTGRGVKRVSTKILNGGET
jgi:hypothetical protein